MGVWNRISDKIQERIDRRVAEFQELVEERILEVKSYWESMFEPLNDLFETDPMYRKEYDTPENFIKGELFEEFALGWFPPQEYILLNRTHDFRTNELRFVEESLYYDFRLEYKETSHDFAVECKYRSGLYYDKLNWAKKFQMDRYKEYEEKNCPGRYYVMMGLGGDPDDPEELYFVPLSDINYVGLYPSVLEKYRITSYPIKCDGR